MSPNGDAIVRLAWTQLWQVTLLAVLVAIVVRLACRRRPHLAYVLWLVVLVKCLTPPLWSSPTSVFSWAQTTPVAVAVEFVAEPPRPAVELVEEDAQAITPDELAPPAEPSRSAAAPSAFASEARPPARTSRNFWIATAGSVWIAGLLVYLTWAVGSIIYCARRVERHRQPDDTQVSALVAELAARLGLRRGVRLAIVDAPIGPLTYGWLRPILVLPVELTSKPASELEPILAHELIHVRRGDAMVGLLQVAAQALWWFHPLVWLMNRGLCAERERCCDEEAIASLGYEPVQYGRGLLNVLELKRQSRLPAAVPGIRPFEVTRRRLEYLVSHSKLFRKRMPRRYWLGLLLALAIVLPGAGMIRQQRNVTAREPAATSPDTWSVTGRIVDHRGQPVADAEVILLGEERIGVEADRRTWFVLGAANAPDAKPKSVRTASDGAFQIERTGKDANRLAVIGADPVFWVVKRDQLPASGEIKLPAPGSIAVELNLPGKPAKQEMSIQLRTYDGQDWEVDLLRNHPSLSFATNPGTTVFEHLPPGTYAVERAQMSQIDTNAKLMTMADRQLATVAAGGQAKILIDRKQGRPLSGRVTGWRGRISGTLS